MIENRWTDTLLDNMRHEGDPPADEVIKAMSEAGNIEALNHLMRTLIENDDLPSEELPPIVVDYLARTSCLPSWADRTKLLAGSRLFNRYGPEIVLLLFGASLPILYAAHPGNQALAATTRMTHNIHRRIIETGQFIIDITAENAWEPDGYGFRSVQKVRLIHAAVRYYLWHHPAWKQQWNEAWLVPICQEDLVGTMLSFSVTTLQGLMKSNISLSDDEKEAYLHLWKVVGHLLGIYDELMPVNYTDAVMQMERWSQRNHRPTEAGQELMKAMVDFWYLRVPGRLFDGVTSGWARLWVGDELADMLGIPPFDWTLNLLKMQTSIWKYEDRFEDSFVPYQWFTRFWSRRLIKALMAIERGGQRPNFRIPEHLQEAWHIK